VRAMQERAMLCRISATVAQAPQHSHAIATLRNRLCLQGRGLNVSTLTLGSLSHKRVCWGPRPKSGRLLVTASEATKGWGDVAQKDSQQRMLQVVLVSPQIPGNTGCIARTCAATCVGLHLVEPLGYKIEDAKLKRAGLDYWPYVVVKVHKSWSDFFDYFQQQEGKKRLLAYTKKGSCVHTDVKHEGGDWLLFGSEVDGLPSAALEQCSTGQYAGGTIRLPMSETYVRSLNLSVSAGVAVYEALRQLDAHTNYSSLNVSPIEAMESVNSGHNDGFP